MGLILRIDVDKPFGRHTLIRKFCSKIMENYFPFVRIKIGYLSHLKEFIEYCNSNDIVGTFFYRLCTSPDPKTIELMEKGKHNAGLHLENSSSKTTFLEELNMLQSISGIKIDTFSKHGSGIYKLGKYHNPKYEPEVYKKWSKEFNISFPSGNGIPLNSHDLQSKDGFFESVFWIEQEYRAASFDRLEDLIKFATNNDAVVLIHPCNYIADIHTKKSFHRLVELASEYNIEWKLFQNTIL